MCASRGQEALRSAYSVDVALAEQTNSVTAPQPDSLRLGPVLLNLGVYAGVSYDDNINASQDNPLSDVSFHQGLNLGFLWPATVNSTLNLSTDIGYVTYLKGTRSDSIEISPSSALAWTISFEDGSLTFYDQFSYSEEVITVPSIAGINSLPRLENTIGVRSQWTRGKWQWQAGLSHNDFQSTDPAFNYLDRGSEYLYLSGERHFGESTAAGMELSASQTAYRIHLQSDNTSYSIGPYINWTISQFTSLKVSGGPTIYQFEAVDHIQPASTLSSYYFNFELSNELTQFISHSLSARRDISLGYNRGNQYTELLSLIYAVNWTATQNLGLGFNITYENGTQPLTGTTENFDRLNIGLNASYRFTENLGGGISFGHWNRFSNIQGNNYTENSISFRVNYNF